MADTATVLPGTTLTVWSAGVIQAARSLKRTVVLALVRPTAVVPLARHSSPGNTTLSIHTASEPDAPVPFLRYSQANVWVPAVTGKDVVVHAVSPDQVCCTVPSIRKRRKSPPDWVLVWSANAIALPSHSIVVEIDEVWLSVIAGDRAA